jgi:hypothetical protein
MKPTRAALSPTDAGPSSLEAAATRAALGAGTLVELYRVLLASGRWWLIPMVVILMLTAILLTAVAAVEYVAPFVYTVF